MSSERPDANPESEVHIRSATVAQGRLLPGIHGLRGIAALAVVLYHLVHLAKIAAPEPFSFIASDFGKGVHLFFIISAFSLMYSTEHTMTRPQWARDYFVKRFFRIAPLYYCLMGAMLLWPAIKSHALNVSLQALILNLSFTFGFAPWTGIVWAGWTVGVEMLFYAIFPVLLLTLRTAKTTFLLLAISLIVSYAARSTLSLHYESHVAQYGYNWAYFSFAANLCFFILGIYAFRVAVLVDREAPMMRWFIPLGSTVLLGALILAKPGSELMPWKDEPILWGISFAGLCLWQSTRPGRWSANRFFEYLGERSYSVYLLHPVVIILLKNPLQGVYAALLPYLDSYAYFVCALLLLVPLLLLAETSYRLIEVPGIRFGKMINSQPRQLAGATRPHSQDGLGEARRPLE